MAYDNSSLTGDEICDYYYDIENNFMNPPSPTGFFIYKVIGGAFDWLNDLIAQFRIDYSILDCNVGNVEIVNSFPEEPNTNHTYYVSTVDGLTKYSYNGSEWVSEIVTGGVLNSLDVFWGRSYNLLRPILYEGIHREYLFEDLTGDLTKYSGADSRVTTSSANGVITLTWVSGAYQFWANADGSTEFDYTGDFTVEFDLLSNGNSASIQIYDGSASAYYSKSLNQLNGMNAGHFKIVKEGQVFRTYVDGVEKTNHQVNSNITNACRVGFRQSGASTIKFRNFKIYRGEDKERPLTDEEYKIYLYLKNHQLLTMKDLLVAFSNAFGSAETSTTILNSIHTVDHKTYDNPPFSNDSLRAYDDEDTDITTNQLVDKDGVNLINNRLAQGTTSILIPDDGWDEEFISLLESFISIKGNILISQGG